MSIVLYTCRLTRLRKFYTEALGFSVIEGDDSYALLMLEKFELLLQQAPESVTSQIQISKPASPRSSNPIKPVLVLAGSMSDIRQQVIDAGGTFNEADSEWYFRESRVCDGADSEGNIFQIRVSDQQIDTDADSAVSSDTGAS